MSIPITDADGILRDLRHASVDRLLGRAVHRRALALLRRPARDAPPAPADHAGALGAPMPGPMTGCGREHRPPVRRHDRRPGREACPASSAVDLPDGPMETTP